jgi:hypothetical protein
MDRTADRLEEAAKNVFYLFKVNVYGKVMVDDYVNQIDQVTADQV